MVECDCLLDVQLRRLACFGGGSLECHGSSVASRQIQRSVETILCRMLLRVGRLNIVDDKIEGIGCGILDLECVDGDV